MATSDILLYILHAISVLGFSILTAWLYYNAGDESWNREGYLFLAVSTNLLTLAFFGALIYRLTVNSLAA